ncbi:MAG: hypothetical protein JF603_13900 [Acidobacteria bacterium]|nr:hypothetical protein [Acidobacteriota bacterium]
MTDEPALSTENQAAVEAELAAMQDELANTPASVVVANHAVGLFQLAAIHLNRRPPNLDEGRLAIDAMACLVDGLGEQLGEQAPTLQDALAQLRLAYVQLAQAGPDASL